ncbi:PREDICTED: zinc finger protein PLAG1-like [Dufourea novaeangliae]|uniref:zinc finger protein PLAG1-like n=1 Tax=Dufourea novaeangliae TaxID=178035 RepID=UPI0007672CD1|nr:PREDICTED: zinc finger protein PLAG1-like [Dufourea novaeangliae]
MTGLTLNSLNTPPSAKKLFRCQLCHKELCSKASLKRHVADKHAARQEEYRCVICERIRYGQRDASSTVDASLCHVPDAAANGGRHKRANVCEFCNRRYRTKNSLTTHKSLQHRGSSGMLKKLLKTTGIKVLGSMHQAQMHQQQQQQPQ